MCLKARAKLRKADDELVSLLQGKLNEAGDLCLSESDIDNFLRNKNKNVILDALRRKHNSDVYYFKSKLDFVCFEKQSTNSSCGFEPQTLVPAVFGYDSHLRVYGGVAMFCSPERNERIEPDPSSRSFVVSSIYKPGMLNYCKVWEYVERSLPYAIQEKSAIIEKLKRAQSKYLDDFIKYKGYRIIYDTTQLQKEFKTKRDSIIKQWEENIGLKWPVDKNGKRLEAHHIISLQFGGPPLDWWNITPLDAEAHRLGNNSYHSSDEYKFAKKYLKDTN